MSNAPKRDSSYFLISQAASRTRLDPPLAHYPAMLTTQKERRSFIIRSNFVRIAFHEGVLRIQQSNLVSPDSEVYFLELEEVPLGEMHLFNSVRHVYNYLTARPECIIQMTEEIFKFVVAVHGGSHICCLSLRQLQLSEEELWFRKNSYRISIKMQEGRLAQERIQAECKALRKKAREASEMALSQKQKLGQAQRLQVRLLEQMKQRRDEREQLDRSLRRKEEILKEIKIKEGAFVALDD